MLNRLISKTYNANYEAPKKDDAAEEEASNGRATSNRANQAVGAAVSSSLISAKEEDSPRLASSEDDHHDDAPVLVDRRPSASSFPRVRVVDGGLTYDNVPITPPAATINGKETNDLVTMMDANPSYRRCGDDEENEASGGRNREHQARENEILASVSDDDDDASLIPLIGQEGPNSVEIEGPEEAKEDDPLLLSLHVSDLDLSRIIQDMSFEIPSDAERANNDIVLVRKEGSSKVAADEDDGAIGDQSISSSKSTAITTDASNSENPETKKSRPAAADVEWNKRPHLRFVNQRALLSFSILLVSILSLARILGGNDPSMVPFSPSSSSSSASSPSSSSSSANTDPAQTLRFGDAIEEPATGAAASLITAQPKPLEDSGAADDAQATPLFAAKEGSSNWNASGIAHQHDTEDGGMKLLPTLKLLTLIDVELPKAKADAAARGIDMDEDDQGLRVFPKLHADGVAVCEGSRSDFGMGAFQLGVLALLLAIAATRRLGSRDETIPKDGGEAEKDEDDDPKNDDDSIRRYDLSKYHDDHTVADLRGLLRIRKCQTAGKKRALALRLASVYEAELGTLTVVQLRKILKSKNFTQRGTKAEIIRALVEDCP